jgi:L-lactate dehydrogenase
MMPAGSDGEGYKGFALSLWNEALTVLSGGSANNPDVVDHQSFALWVIDPAVFSGSDYFLAEMKRFKAYVKSSPSRPGFEEVRLPGERGFSYLSDCRENGIPLTGEKIELLRDLAVRNGLEPVA